MSDTSRLFLSPRVDASAWVAPNATLLGDVVVGARSSIWYGCVIRGDADRIEIGSDTNIQDLTMVHVDDDVACLIGDRVAIGHRAIIHGCTIGDGALIGMGAIVLNGAVVEAGAIVGAGSVVTEGTIIPAGMLAIGAPARVHRPVDPALAARREGTWQHYVAQAERHRQLWISRGSG